MCRVTKNCLKGMVSVTADEVEQNDECSGTVNIM